MTVLLKTTKNLKNKSRINTYMITFKEIREKTNPAMPAGKHEFSKKVGKHTVMVHKQGSKYVVYIDGEKLDDYRNLAQAKSMGLEFAKEASR